MKQVVTRHESGKDYSSLLHYYHLKKVYRKKQIIIQFFTCDFNCVCCVKSVSRKFWPFVEVHPFLKQIVAAYVWPAIAHIIQEFSREGCSYKGTIFPVVKDGKGNHRRDKRTDYYIFKIKNKQIRIVIEVKTRCFFS